MFYMWQTSSRQMDSIYYKSDEPLKTNELDIKFINTNSITPDKSVVGDVLDKLDLKDLCCRTIMLSNVHLITSI